MKADKDKQSKHVYRPAPDGGDLLKGREELFVKKQRVKDCKEKDEGMIKKIQTMGPIPYART